MKRLWVILGALAVICALSVTEASAQKLAKRDLAWLDQTASSWNTGRFKDRTAITNSGTGIDTLQYFSLLGCVKPTGNPETASLDSTMIAQLVFITDSTVAVTNDLTVVSYVTEVSNDGVNWQSVVAVTTNTVSSGDKMWTIPLWVHTSEGFGANTIRNNPYFASMIRVRAIAATGNQYAVKAQLWYWE